MAADEDDQNLATDNGKLNCNEPFVPENSFENVELIVDTAGTAK